MLIGEWGESCPVEAVAQSSKLGTRSPGRQSMIEVRVIQVSHTRGPPRPHQRAPRTDHRRLIAASRTSTRARQRWRPARTDQARSITAIRTSALMREHCGTTRNDHASPPDLRGRPAGCSAWLPRPRTLDHGIGAFPDTLPRETRRSGDHDVRSARARPGGAPPGRPNTIGQQPPWVVVLPIRTSRPRRRWPGR